MNNEIKCLSCNHEWLIDSSKITGCPKCGGTTLGVEFTLTVGVGIDSLEYKGISNDGKKVLSGHAKRDKTKSGETAGTDAWNEQMVDKTIKPARYKKKITLSDGTISKDVDGLLSDQSLHGPQKKE